MKAVQHFCLCLLALTGGRLAAQNWAKLETNLPEERSVTFIDVVDKNTAWGAVDNGFFIPADKLYVARTTDGGATFQTTAASNEPGEYCTAIHGLSASTCWVLSVNVNSGGGKVFVTRDGGQTWQRKAANAFTDGGSFPDFINFSDDKHGYMLGDPVNGEYQIYTTSDAGETWAQVPGANIADPTPGEFGLTMGYAVNGSTIFAVTANNRLLKSADNGQHWTAQDLPPMTGQGAPYSIAFSDAKNGMLTYNYNNGQTDPTPGANSKPLVTKDGGATWQVIANSDFDQFDESGQLTYVPGTDGTFVSGNYDGWAYTTDYGVHWKYVEDPNMRLPFIECLDWQTCYGGVFAEFGHTSGDFARFIGTALAPKGLNTPHFSVKTWPNPTQGDLNVGLYAPYDYDISCFLHNFTSGKVEATGILPAGQTSVYMDCSSAPPGVYSLRMVCGKRVETAMVFVKMY